MENKGLFISVEGGEGVGKSSFCSGLVTSLENNAAFKYSGIVRTHEPGGTENAQAIRELFLKPPGSDNLTKMAELFLVSAARNQHIAHKVRPALENDQLVICDRFYDSTRVYQGYLAGIPEAKVDSIIKHSVEGIHPELTFLLDCPTEITQERLAKRHGEGEDMSRFDSETLDFHKNLRVAYLQVADRFPNRVIKLDASGTPDEILESALNKLADLIPNL